MPGTEQYTLPVVHQADREEHEENLKCVKGRNYSHMSHKYWRALILSLFSLPLLVSFLLPPVSRYIIGALHTAHLPVISEGTSGLYEQWKSGFQLFTCWSFASLHRLALRLISPSTPLDQLLLARAYSVDDWVCPALTALCGRTVLLRLSEARQMNIKDAVLITTVREDICPHTHQVNPDEIPNCIEAVQICIHAGAGWGAPVSSSLMMEGANFRSATPTSPPGSTTAPNGTGPSTC